MAFSSRKGKPKGSPKTGSGGSPLDARQRELLEEQTRINEKIAALQSKISQAPLSDREVQRRQRAAAAAVAPTQRRVAAPRHRHSTVLADKRYDEDVAIVPVRNKPSRRRRAEIRQAQMQTLALLIVLVGAVLWVLHWLAIW